MDREATNHNWECRCGYTNWAIDSICHGCFQPRRLSEKYRHMGGPRWVEWTREHQGSKDLTDRPVAA